MKKLLSLILVFVLILPLCGRGFAAYDNLALSAFKSELEDGVIVNTFVYVGEGGHVARREIDRIAPTGQLLGKQTTNYDAKGNMISGRMAGFNSEGLWQDQEYVTTYNDDGTYVENRRCVFTYPGNRREFLYLQTTGGEGIKSESRGEARDINGNKLYDHYVTEYTVDGDKYEETKNTYPNGTTKEDSVRRMKDGTVITQIGEKNADGDWLKAYYCKRNPDGSRTEETSTYTYLDNGKIRIWEKVEGLGSDGIRTEECVSSLVDRDGNGWGRGVFKEENGSRSATVEVQYRNNEEEGEVAAKVYKYADGTIDLRYTVTSPDGKYSDTFEKNVQNYDGGDDVDDSEKQALDADVEAMMEAEQTEGSFAGWEEAFADGTAFQTESVPYIGDPSGLDTDVETDIYEPGVDWNDSQDWGDESDWSPSWDDSGADAWDAASGVDED